MEVYFIRHGQTDGNVARRHQHVKTSLNELGLAQAKAVADKVSRLKPTHLITSTYIRALLTAKEIANACDLLPETNPDFTEFVRPDFLVGQGLLGTTTIRYIWRWFRRFPDAHMHDGESYQDFIKRIDRARKYLEKFPPDARVVVVSHSVFMNFFLEHMCNPRPMNLFRAGLRFLKIIFIANVSIIHVRYDSSAKPNICGWRVIRR